MKINERERLLFQGLAAGMVLALAMGAAPARLKTQQVNILPSGQAKSPLHAQAEQFPEVTHRFFDRTNLMLFAGVAAVRALDFTSTEHFRHNGHNEVLLTNSIVDNKPLFAGIEVAGAAASIGLSYLLHRTGHHKLERWVSLVHIGAGAVGDIHNYTLGPAH
ncbi:MAG: hypothetical protein M1404_06700 [Acidobacteria bacterium]|nr:hypothetical protein [Acidobacteriota bacterium]